MKESLEATLKDVELTKEVYRLYTLEHLTQQEISVKLCISRSTVWRKIRTFEAENPELAEKMNKQGKEITPSDYKDLVKEIAELKKQLKTGYTIDENGCLTIKDGGTARGKNTKVAKAVVETGGILAVGDTMLVSKLTVDELTANGTISLKIISGKADQLITTKGITLNKAKIEVCDLSGTAKTGDEFKILNGKITIRKMIIK